MSQEGREFKAALERTLAKPFHQRDSWEHEALHAAGVADKVSLSGGQGFLRLRVTMSAFDISFDISHEAAKKLADQIAEFFWREE